MRCFLWGRRSAIPDTAIATRFLSRDEGIWTSFFYTALLGALFASFIAPFYWEAPDPSDLPWYLVVIVFGSAGQYFLIRSLFLVEATITAPFTYVSLIFAGVYGAAVFGEFPDIWTCHGRCHHCRFRPVRLASGEAGAERLIYFHDQEARQHISLSRPFQRKAG